MTTLTIKLSTKDRSIIELGRQALIGSPIAMYKLGLINKEDLLDMDHDCSSSPEDGCGVCYELVQMGLLAEYDGD